jgi:hypothetical protein
VSAAHSEGNITITTNGGNAFQQTDSLDKTSIRGTGGEGGIIRTPDLNSFQCFSDGGLQAPMITNVNEIISRDSVKAAGGIITSSELNPYSIRPVSSTRLEYFAATAVNETVKVSWVTASEENVDFFTVERSLDGKQFYPVYKTNGKGNTGGKSSYNFEDMIEASAEYQYRLVETGHDDHRKIFTAVRLKHQEKAMETKLISVQPNPVGDEFTIKCSVAEPGLVDITLTDISGNIVRRESAVAGAGLNTISVNNLSDVPKGTYFLSLVSGTQKMSTVKILK